MSQSDSPVESPSRPSRGRPFPNGNPGRPSGAKNRATLVASALLEDEAEELLCAAIESAKGGNVVMLKFLLGRILPKERTVHLDLSPKDDDFDPVDALEAIFNAAVTGQIPPSEASALSNIVGNWARATDAAEFRSRLEAMEASRVGHKPA